MFSQLCLLLGTGCFLPRDDLCLACLPCPAPIYHSITHHTPCIANLVLAEHREGKVTTSGVQGYAGKRSKDVFGQQVSDES